MEDRMDILGGDYSYDFIDDDCDLIRAGASLNFARHDVVSLMKKIFDALNLGRHVYHLSWRPGPRTNKVRRPRAEYDVYGSDGSGYVIRSGLHWRFHSLLCL